MGLTIHWNQKNKKQYIDEKTAERCIDFIKTVAEREKWPILAQWDKTINPSEYPKMHLTKDQSPESTTRQTTRVIGISVHPHEDCESLVFEFDTGSGKLNHYYDYSHGKYQSDGNFCKTHYSNFATHKKVCRLLEAISKHFVKLDVYDEGHYYGVWNDEQGKKQFGEYVAHVHNFGQTLKDVLGGENVTIVSSESQTNGWKEEYVDHLARQIKEGKKGISK